MYAREGVAHAWLVNPGERTLEVLRLESGRWVIVSTFGGDAIVRAEPFEEVAIDLLPFWGESRKAAKARPQRKLTAKRARRRS